MNVATGIILLITVFLFGYLIVALLYPEKF
ncbi:MAG: K(+)-transporting ATPase subunit F [Acidobacteriaceae bacterium]|jgi:K+-transporting ATPase KdpF subunit